ncbi:energy-coupling factor transporter transmembrane component T family protein [Calothrix sp. NIES-3974]|uniref:energy-coupling factor transporter transmembrane component T family protein n=1 Tax=Calothrix sp. NIES-3974 TaxID=2005462 RepID=UPI000B5FB693|nr:CbiQ family ECF transporter T component [Calothrix sp. NIES-3974]BAZ05178.1 cobalt transport protein [Calothrix sp. NIES-3974]
MDLLRSLPLGLYLEQPQTWLHKLDPRVKLLWLMSFLTTYVFASNLWRISLVAILILVTIFAWIPRRVWRQQMGWLLILCFFVFIIAALTPDGLGVNYQPRRPINESVSLAPPTIPSTPPPTTPSLPPPVKAAQNYRYVLVNKGLVRVTRRSLDLAVSLSTLLFTIIYSTNLYLLTTAPESITAAIEDFMQPLRRFKLPVTEIALTLTLSLRFIPLVLEEVQNLIQSVMTRAINWKKLGIKGGLKVWLIVAERLLDNLLLRAEQMANAMVVRGFTSPNEHRVQWHDFHLKIRDWFAILMLLIFWGVRIAIGVKV